MTLHTEEDGVFGFLGLRSLGCDCECVCVCVCVCVCGSSGGGSLTQKATQPATSQATG